MHALASVGTFATCIGTDFMGRWGWLPPQLKVLGAMLSSHPHRNYVVIFWNGKMFSENYECDIMPVTKVEHISAWKYTKSVWQPGSAWTPWERLQHSPDLAGFKAWGEIREGKRQKGTGQVRERDRGRRGGEGNGGEEKSRPHGQSFVKVGAYGYIHK